MTVKCKKCGAEMADDARFCMNCGAEAEIRMNSMPGEASPPPPPPTPAPPVQPKNSNVGKLIFACVVLLAAVLGFTYYFLSGGAPDDIRDYMPAGWLSDICGEFLINQKAAEEKYVGKKVILTGIVEETGTVSILGKPYVSLGVPPIFFDDKATCVFSRSDGLKDLKLNAVVNVIMVRGVIDSISHDGKGGTITMSKCALCTAEEIAKAFGPKLSEANKAASEMAQEAAKGSAAKPFNGGKSSPAPMENEIDDDAAAVIREREDNGDPYFDEELVLIGEVTGSNVRVRAKPYLDAAVNGKVSYGKVLVYESLYRNGKKWFHVMKELKNGNYLNGWMSADFIRIKREGNEKALSQRDDI